MKHAVSRWDTRHTSGVLFAVAIVCSFAILAAPPNAGADVLVITSAKYDTKKGFTTVQGIKAQADVMVTSPDSGVGYGTAIIDPRGKWKLSHDHTQSGKPVPCRVQATDGVNTTEPLAVTNAPADCDGGGPLPVNQPPVCVIDTPTADVTIPLHGTIAFTATVSDPDGDPVTITWAFPGGAPAASNLEDPGDVAYHTAGTFTATLDATDGRGGACTQQSRTITVEEAPPPPPPPPAPDVSINSNSQGCGETGLDPCPGTAVDEADPSGTGANQILAINDLGMHCGDLDTRIASILPPFQVLLAQVIQKGDRPRLLGPTEAQVYYSAASNPDDPILTQTDPDPFTGLSPNGVYKTNFWDYPVPQGSYDPFYPADLTPLATTSNPAIGQRPVEHDVGLPVPNPELLYIGTDEHVGGADTSLRVAQHEMPGILGPGTENLPKLVEEHLRHRPFFIGFPFGYVANDVNWFEGAGIPYSAYDDFGRENPYPLARVQAKSPSGTLLASVDTVLPISGEASCKNCHADPLDSSFGGTGESRTGQPTQALLDANLPVADSDDDPQKDGLPIDVSIEWATDINILRLHDLKNGSKYVDTSGAETPCTIDEATPNGTETCLTNLALVQDKPVVCQLCHYTPALDLAQVGPLAGPSGTDANGRNQLAHQSNSRVMHSHHGQFTDLFPPIPAPVQGNGGVITNQAERLAKLEDSCYQCHPGKSTKCLRGAMFNGDVLCSDCHGDMRAVGADFSQGVSPATPGQFKLGLGNFYEPGSSQPRVPWANEPGCGSCHTGDALTNALTLAGDGVDPTEVLVNTHDVSGSPDGIRLRQAYRKGDAKATPIVPVNIRFSENPIPESFNGFANPGAGEVGSTGARNPKLYRVSTGHGGLFCESCHGATHVEWPNANPLANDNQTAKQLQDHAGVIVECDTCHNPAAFEDSGTFELTTVGPHGMHAVGSILWNKKHKEARVDGGDNCRECHGPNGEGTVLSRMARERSLLCKDGKGTMCTGEGYTSFPKGHRVGCADCHENKL